MAAVNRVHELFPMFTYDLPNVKKIVPVYASVPFGALNSALICIVKNEAVVHKNRRRQPPGLNRFYFGPRTITLLVEANREMNIS